MARYELLIVDDDPAWLDVLRDLLEADYILHLTINGPEALAIVSRASP